VLALCPSRVLAPDGFETQRCVIVEDGKIAALLPLASCPSTARKEQMEGDLVPGFIDIQVNGGGGVLFNDEPTIEGIEAIGRAHRRFGTTGFLATLISDELETIDKAMRAVEGAIRKGVPGILGIHIEGPFINPEKRGIHDERKIRRIDEAAVELLSSLSTGVTLVTLAPELARTEFIEMLVAKGVLVAAGHTAASYDEMRNALGSGVGGFTHLFNAMSQMSGRSPGVVGAALESDAWCGIIVDGFHVHPASLRIALAAKGPEKLILVTDAMPSVGSGLTQFMLQDRLIRVENGRCVAKDGTLAGSNLDMARAVANAKDQLRIDLKIAVSMATGNPARALGLERMTGAISPGLKADLVLLKPDGTAARTWISGIGQQAV
jgi:N-acetylglucosamine-6-phosphate deacetylase